MARQRGNRRPRQSQHAPCPDPAIELYLVDEIGKMECFSARFVAVTQRLLEGGRPVAATVARSGGGFIAEVKRGPRFEIWKVTQRNRDTLVKRATDWLLSKVERA